MIFFWIAAYGFTNILGEYLLLRCDAAEWSKVVILLLYASAFVSWTVQTGNGGKVGLCAVQQTGKQVVLAFLPLAWMPICNVLFGDFSLPSFADIFLMLAVCVTEELFFRGYLLWNLRKRGDLLAILTVSTLFALFHGMNFLKSSDWEYILLQMLCSLGISIYFCQIRICFKSILPCMAAHFLINITGNGTVAGSLHGWSIVVCAAGYICWAVWFPWKRNIG